MIVADIDSNILAMSTEFLKEDINDYWVESRLTRRLPAAALASPLRTPDGAAASWTDQPDIYLMPDGTKIIGSFRRANGELIAGFSLWEYKRPIHPSDLELVGVIYEVLLSTIEAQKHVVPVRSGDAILTDLISGSISCCPISWTNHKSKNAAPKGAAFFRYQKVATSGSAG